MLTAIVAFLAEALRQGEPAVAVATVSQFGAIARGLTAASIDVADARHTGLLTFVDAAEMLDSVVVAGEPDATRFTHQVGTVIDQALRRRPAALARVYSGAVDLLWKRGQVDAATQLERLFYGLARTHAFSLLCAHAMADFYQGRERRHAEAGAAGAVAPSVAVKGDSRRERGLSDREEDVLRRTALGHTNKDIANALSISVRTVEAHKAHAMRKLGLTERADMIQFALSKGWLTGGRQGP